jgi:hypothetical protein
VGCAEDRACAAESVENLITRFDRSPQEFVEIPDKLENGSLEKPDGLNGIERDEAFHAFIPREKVEGPKPLGG